MQSEQPTIDLLSLLLGKVTAKRLYRESLADLFLGNSLPEAARARLAACRELVRRWMIEDLKRGPVLESQRDVAQYLKVHYAGYEREVFGCLFLDNRHRLLCFEELFSGTIDGASVHPREVVKRALQVNAAAVILSHNHPSGVAEPSQADHFITKRLREVLAAVDIRCLDHVIVAGTAVMSFAERGLL